MYKVFFDDRQLILQSTAEPLPNADLVLNLDGKESPAVLKSIVEAFQANTKTSCICLHSSSLPSTWKTFQGLFSEIVAAGGVVINSESKLLMIFRNGKWDLPKGKLEKSEEIEDAALREVEEECGISDLKIVKPLSPVYHTYTQKGKQYLKTTFWYAMKSDFKGELIPQTEEGITEVKWMSRREVIPALENTWASIHELLKEELIRKGNDLK